MKFCAALLIATAASAAAFTPSTKPSAASSNTKLDVITNSDMFDINTGRMPGMMGSGQRTLGGNGYRQGGSGFFPRQGGGSYGSYSSDSYGGYDKIEGNSRRTFDTAWSDSTMVELETDGRPLDAKVEIWEGPNNTPAKMKLWSEDGAERPWGPVGFANFAGMSRTGTGSSMTVDNEGSTEFPIYANVNIGGGGGMGGMRSTYMGTSRRQTMRIDGNGAQQSFNIGPGPCIIEIWSEGFPYYANVEVWDGPNNVKQSAEVYADSGFDRPWSAVIESPGGEGGTIQIKNPGPVEYPLRVSVEPLGGMGGYGGGYGGRGGGYY